MTYDAHLATTRHRVRRLAHDIAVAGRMAQCGTYRTHFDVHAGIYKSFRLHCNRKDCPQCRKRLGYFLQKRVNQLDIQVSALDAERALQLRRKLGMANYVNVPTVDGALIFWQPERYPALAAAYPATAFSALSYDWADLQDTPAGMNISGRLNAYLPPERGPDLVYVPQIVIKAAQGIDDRKLALKATLGTLVCFPQTRDELQLSIYQRTNAMLDLLDQAKVAYEVVHVKTRVDVSKIDWRAGILAALKQLTQELWWEYKNYFTIAAKSLGDKFADVKELLYKLADDLTKPYIYCPN